MHYTKGSAPKNNRGFTLIELLVVVSIISLLSSIVLASLKESRGKAQDSKVVSQLLEMRSVAELNNSAASYGIADTANGCGTLDTAFTNAKFNTGGSWPTINGVSNIPICYSDAAGSGDLITSYSLWNNLNNSSGWCVDSEGRSVRLDSAPNNYICTSGGGGDDDGGGGGTAFVGDSCSSNSECFSGFCGYDPNTPNPQICTDGTSAYLCSSDDQCSSNSCNPYSGRCNDSSSDVSCNVPGMTSLCDEGSTCGENYVCYSNIVLTENGGYCVNNEECSSGYCTNYTCANPNGLPGDACTYDYDCNGLYCDPGTNTCF